MRVYLAKLAFMIAVGVGAMTLAAVTAWKLYGPTEPEWIERAPVPERGAAVPASPAFSR